MDTSIKKGGALSSKIRSRWPISDYFVRLREDIGSSVSGRLNIDLIYGFAELVPYRVIA